MVDIHCVYKLTIKVKYKEFYLHSIHVRPIATWPTLAEGWQRRGAISSIAMHKEMYNLLEYLQFVKMTKKK